MKTANRKKEKYPQELLGTQSQNKQIEARATKSSSVLVLHLIGQEDGAVDDRPNKLQNQRNLGLRTIENCFKTTTDTCKWIRKQANEQKDKLSDREGYSKTNKQTYTQIGWKINSLSVRMYLAARADQKDV